MKTIDVIASAAKQSLCHCERSEAIPMSLRAQRSNPHEADEIASPSARNDKALLLAASFAAAVGAAGIAENKAEAAGAELTEEISNFCDIEEIQALSNPFAPNQFTIAAQGGDCEIVIEGDNRSGDFTVTDDASTGGIVIQAHGPFVPIEDIPCERRRRGIDSYLRLFRGDGTPGARVISNGSMIQVDGELRFINGMNDCEQGVASIHPSPIADHLRIAAWSGMQPYTFDLPINDPNVPDFCLAIQNNPALYRVDELAMPGFDTFFAPCTPDGNVCAVTYENQDTRQQSARLKGRNPQGTLVHLGCAANAQTGLLECTPEPRPGRTGRPDSAFNFAQAFTTIRTPSGRDIDLGFVPEFYGESPIIHIIPHERVNGDSSVLREVPATITLSPNPAPLDSDNDGNPDMTDRCPGRADAEDITVAEMTGAEPRPEPYEPGAACAANCRMPDGQDHYPLTSEPADGQIQQENGLRLCESDHGIRDILGLPHALINEDATLTLYANRPDIAVSPDTTEINTLPGDQFILVDTAAPTTPAAVRNLNRTIHIPPNFPARLRIFSATRPDGTPGRIVFRHERVTDDDPFAEEVIWEGPPDPEALQDGWINLPAGSGGGGELGVEGCVLHLEVALEPVLPACPPVCGEPDAGQPPQADAGVQQDVGTPPQDAGQPVADAGPPQDAEQPRPDAEPRDAGSPFDAAQGDSGADTGQIASPDARNDRGDAGNDADTARVIPDPDPESPDANPIVIPPVDAGCAACAPDAGNPPQPDAEQPPVADTGTADAGQQPDSCIGLPVEACVEVPDSGPETGLDAQPDAVLVRPDADAGKIASPDARNDSGDAGKIASPDARNDNGPAARNDTNDSGCSCEIASLNDTETPNNPLFLLASAIAAAYAGTRRRIKEIFGK